MTVYKIYINILLVFQVIYYLYDSSEYSKLYKSLNFCNTLISIEIFKVAQNMYQWLSRDLSQVEYHLNLESSFFNLKYL